MLWADIVKGQVPRNLTVMANNPISMSKIRHILRLHSQGRSKLVISAQTGVARNTLKKYLKEFTGSGLSFAEIDSLSDKDFEDLFIKPAGKPQQAKDRLELLLMLFPSIEKELKRKGMNRQLLWEDYKRNHPDGFGRSQFNAYYRQWKAQASPTMRIDHNFTMWRSCLPC
jgi:transposase